MGCIHGHNHPDLNKAIIEQVGKISHSTLLGLVSPPSAQLAKELVDIAPEGLEKVFFSDDGSTAIEVALKMAISIASLWGKQKRRNLFPLRRRITGILWVPLV